MPTLADSLKTSSGRPLTLRRRPDLTTREHRYQGRSYWVVKEPVGLKYFRFQEEEYAILQMLDGTSSLDDIKSRFETRFAPQKITLGELQQFIGSLHRNGLVTSAASGQGRQLKRRRDERSKKEWKGKLTNVLAIRFKGIDPQRFLNWVYPHVSWFFTRTALTLCILTALSALTLILVQFDVFQSKLPAFYEFFGPKNWFWLAVTLGVTKVLHELGHGLACKHFGGECHEIGVMFLVLTPCLYCNVSDSWMLPSKWKRAAIGAAGMYVEVVLASIATFIWWFSEPGMINHLCLRVMFVCSVSTVLFNGNPLLRYDGYYILSDLIEIPNLRQKSTSILNRIMARWCLGMELPEEPFLPQRNHAMFAFYTVAAVIYRWVVLISILLFLYKVFEPYGLQIIGQAIAAMSIGTMIGKPAVQLYKFMTHPGRMQQMKRRNMIATASVVAAVVTVVMLIPLPRRVMCTMEIRPHEAESIYVDVPGTLAEVRAVPGKPVKRGQTLARIDDVDLRLRVAELEGQLGEQEALLEDLKRQRFIDPRAAEEVAEAEETLASIEQQLEEKKKDLERLEVISPINGTVIPPAPRPDKPVPDGTLREWVGSPLDPKNQGAKIDPSEMLCQIGDPRRLKAVLIIDQGDIEWVREQQEVAIKLDAFPSVMLHGTIEDLAEDSMDVAPKELSAEAGGDLATVTDKSGVQRPLSTSYIARVPLTDNNGDLRIIGLRGRARINTGWQPLGSRVWRYLSHTFHFWL